VVSSFFPVTCSRLVERLIELRTILPDRFAGPFQSQLAWQQIQFSALQTTAVAIALWILFRKNNLPAILLSSLPSEHPRNRRHILLVAGVLAICVWDSCLTARWQLLTVPAQTTTASISEPRQLTPRFWLLDRSIPWPDHWQNESSPQRWPEVEKVTHEQRFMRLHLLNNEAVVNSPTSIRSTLLEWAWHSVAEHRRQLDATSLLAFDRQFMDRFAIDHQVSGAERNDPWLSVSTPGALTAGLESHSNTVTTSFGLPASRTFLSWHSDWQAIEHDDTHRLKRLQNLIASLSTPSPLLPQVAMDIPMEPTYRQDTVLAERNLADLSGGTEPTLSNRQIRWIKFEPMHYEFYVQAEEFGLLRIAQFQDGHWRAHLKNEQGVRKNCDVHRVDELCQGIFLAPGKHHIVLEYDPSWFMPTMVLASVTWLFLATWFLAEAIQKAFIVRACNSGTR
jgi:hypothetical protein